jgi:hypothetical protein
MPSLAAANVRLVGAFHVVLTLEKKGRSGGTRSIDKVFRAIFSTVHTARIPGEIACSDVAPVAIPSNERALFHRCA